jgi:NAD(P)-dependent dehydrogenase (short-subunit alcohol dehydrogenase family)
MTEMSFDGRVAIVTGAGAAAGLGRAYARFLASRGARVVVNDLGTGPDGRGIQLAHADRIAQEIRDDGGDAVADTHSVAEESSAKAVVQTALDQYGRVDILVNNAGVVRLGRFSSATPDDISQLIAVHLSGSVWMCHAVWPHMLEQRYGRIVNVTSLAMWGAEATITYGAAKAGAFGLTRGLAVEGAASNVRVNALAPIATSTASRYFAPGNPTQAAPGRDDRYTPEAVAPVVGYLCHEDCLLNGAYVATGRGHVAIGEFGTTRGYECGPEVTPEAIRDNLAAITDVSDVRSLPSGSDILALDRQGR